MRHRVPGEEGPGAAPEPPDRVFDASPTPMLVTRLADGRVLDVNQSFLAMLGYERNHLLGADSAFSEMWVDARQRESFLDRLSRDGSVSAWPVVLRGQRGAEMHLLACADAIGCEGEKRIVWQVVYAGEQRDALDALRMSEERYRSLMESSPLGVAVTDRKLKISRANAALAQLVGAPSASALIGAQYSCRVAVLPGMREAVRRALDKGESSQAMVVGATPWGKDVELLVRLVPFRETSGAVSGVQAIVEDAAALRRLKHDLLQAARMEGIGLLASGMVHDFSNYLSVIDIYSTNITRTTRDREAARQAGQIAEVSHRCTALVDHILALAREPPAESQGTDLAERLRELAGVIQSAMGSAVQVEMNVAANLGRVAIDPARFDHLVLNLALNARDAMPQGGPLAVEVRPVDLADANRPEGLHLPDGPYALLVVRDTGVGMDGAIRRRIFDPFFTTKKSGKGTGLGLWVVQHTVHEAGGEVRVCSERGRGTTVQVFLPIRTAP